MRRVAVLVVVTFALALPCAAQEFCWDAAGAEAGLPAALLRAVSAAESRHNPTAYAPNRDGSYDYSHMQINSRWFFQWEALYGRAYAERTWAALTDPCYATRVGAWILADCYRRFGNSWKSIGCYNSTKEKSQIRYAWNIYRELQGIQNTKKNKTKGADKR